MVHDNYLNIRLGGSSSETRCRLSRNSAFHQRRPLCTGFVTLTDVSQHVILGGDVTFRLRKMETLAFFVVQCRGIKFYDKASIRRMQNSVVEFRRFPSNPHDSFCVEALIPSSSGGYEKLGHVARTPARLLSPLYIFTWCLILVAVSCRHLRLQARPPSIKLVASCKAAAIPRFLEALDFGPVVKEVVWF